MSLYADECTVGLNHYGVTCFCGFECRNPEAYIAHRAECSAFSAPYLCKCGFSCGTQKAFENHIARKGSACHCRVDDCFSSGAVARTRRLAEAPSKRLVGFDFDCTLTVKHFYKVFTCGYAQGNANGHPHCKAFFDWCLSRDIDPEMQEALQQNDIINAALEDFCRHAGQEAFRDVIREVFLGGSERIALVAAWLKRMQFADVEFAIVTAGTSTAVLRVLAVTPEWLPFFPVHRVWDTQQGRHSIWSVASMKALMLRDIFPSSCQTLLVDDALSHDRPASWVLEAANVQLYEGLQYEGAGVTKHILEEIERTIFE